MSRPSGRTNDQARECEAKVGVIKNALGSAYFKIGKTICYAAVYKPGDLHPKRLSDPKTGLLRCTYNMLPFSGSGPDRIRPGGNRRSKEISEITTEAISKVLNLKKYPGCAVDVHIEILQADAGTRCAGVCAASMALADAGFEMLDLPVALGVGMYKGEVIVDLDYIEDSQEDGVDIPCAVMPSTGEVTLLQMDGIISKEHFMEALNKVRPVAQEMYNVMAAALKEKYKVVEE